MNEKPENIVAGPKTPPGHFGLKRWVDIRILAPLVLVLAAWFWATHPLAIASSSGLVHGQLIATDPNTLIARPHPSPSVAPPRPKPTETVMQITLAQQQAALAAAQQAAATTPGTTATVPQQQAPPPPPPPAPTAPPTQSPAQIEAVRRAQEDRDALNAPLVVTPVRRLAQGLQSQGYWLERGMIIPATLFTSIDSTIPGTIIAYVAQDIYDFGHRVIVIPYGAKLICSFGANNFSYAQGQARIPSACDEVQMDNRILELGDEPGMDRTGTTGFGARVDRHTRAAVQNFVIITAAGLLLDRAGGSQQCGMNCSQASGTGNTSVGAAVVSSGTQLLQNRQQLEPTLHVAEGAQIAIMLRHRYRMQEWTP